MTDDLRNYGAVRIKLRCCCSVASRPTWENRPCRIPATIMFRDRLYCHIHAPKRKKRNLDAR